MPFTIKGSGFGASEPVDITFDATVIGAAVTTPAGTFKEKLTVPNIAEPGRHTVTATGEESGLVASTPFRVRTNWPRLHFDNANTSYNPYENVLTTTNVGGLVQKWAFDAGGTFAPSPVVAYGRVYVASTDGVVTALDAATGAVLWSYDTLGPISIWYMTPTAANNLVYVGNDNGQVFALSASTGVPAWTTDVDGVASGAPVVGGGTMYLGLTPGVTALDAATGAVKWSSVMGPIHPPTLAYGLLYAENDSFECSINAFDAASGSSAWSDTFCTEGADMETAAAANGLIYTSGDYTRALAAQSGAVRWINTDDSFFKKSPSVANNVVYVSTAEGVVPGHLRALDASTGTQLWAVDFAGPTQSSTAVANGVVYLGEEDGLYAYDASNGAFLWKSADAGQTFNGTPAVADGMAYSSTSDGTVHAYGLP